MPTTGNGSTIPAIALMLVAVAFVGGGLKLARRKA
jgi:LPXTG-motif cell wall-anchored protein